MTPGPSQRPAAAESATLVRHLFDKALRDAAAWPPAAPRSFAELLVALDDWSSAAAQRPPLPESLVALRQSLFDAPGRDPELRQLWRSSLATAAGAWRLAQGGACSPAEVALGGLLHRAGAARLFAVIAGQESIAGLRLHAAIRRQLEAAHEAMLHDALLAGWQVPADAARSSRDWRAALDDSPAHGGAPLVYLAQLLAGEALQPQFHPPALASGVAARLRIDAPRLQAARLAASLAS